MTADSLTLAEKYITASQDEERSASLLFAKELLDTQQRLEKALTDCRRLVGERDAAQAKAAAVKPPRIWPVVVRCDSCRVEQPFHTDDEPRVLQALVALGWSVETGHRCPGCARLTVQQVREAVGR